MFMLMDIWYTRIWIPQPLRITCWLLRFIWILWLMLDLSGVVNVAAGPSHKSMAYAVDAILNGVEIMKMNNLMGSFDGKVPAKSVSKCREEEVVAFYSLRLLLCVYLSAVMRIDQVDSVPWSKLPVDVPETTPKQGKQQFSGKV
ncbi:hypothetical protein V6N13_086967 [Hibiscus sabdariffa]|uniref:Uncharacterized protein n=1 Tax=Hibiscus sabdariffa TaxID=183260 RepID=A0ABR2FVL5_9ROSI